MNRLKVYLHILLPKLKRALYTRMCYYKINNTKPTTLVYAGMSYVARNICIELLKQKHYYE